MMALHLGNSILPNFIEQSFVADLQQLSRLLAIPVGLFQRLTNGLAFSLILRAPSQGFQSSASLPMARIASCSHPAIPIRTRLQFRRRQILIAQNQVPL